MQLFHQCSKCERSFLFFCHFDDLLAYVTCHASIFSSFSTPCQLRRSNPGGSSLGVWVWACTQGCNDTTTCTPSQQYDLYDLWTESFQCTISSTRRLRRYIRTWFSENCRVRAGSLRGPLRNSAGHGGFQRHFRAFCAHSSLCP